jgi:hypothetical protein
MATQKVSVTLDGEKLRRARDVVGPRGLSAYLDDALAEKLHRDEQRASFLEYLDELERHDPTPDAIRVRAAKRANRIRAAVE